MGKSFIEHTMLGVLSFVKESVFSDEIALRKGFLQSMEPRIKILTFAAFLLAALFAKSLSYLSFLYLFCLLLAFTSGISLGFFLKRTWVFIPLFSVFIVMPALFTIFTPGEALFGFNFLGVKLAISRTGLERSLLFVTRVTTSVSFVVLLSLVTKHSQLLSVLRIFKIPQVFVMTLGMCYRYIYLFAEIIENTYLGIKSRVGVNLHYKKGQKIVTWRIANLWQKSVKLNEEVYSAMVSRGYSGEPAVFEEFKINTKDWVWLLCAAAILALSVYLNYGPR